MLNRVTEAEADTFSEVTKVLNRLIDHANESELYNTEVEKYNESVAPKENSTKKKGGE